MATGELDKLPEPIVLSGRLSKSDDDADGEGVTADSGEMLSEQVGRSLGIAGGRGADHLDVVALPVRLPAAGDVYRDAGEGVEIGGGEAEARVGGHCAAEREVCFGLVGGVLGLPVPARRLQVRADGASVVLDRRLGQGGVITRAAPLTVTSLHVWQRAPGP